MGKFLWHNATNTTTSIYTHMVRGSAWAIATRWALRLIGLGSTVILARLLTPEDFGVAATGALTIGFIERFSELGVQQLVIRERNTNRADYDTAWTLRILQGVFVASILVVGAPLSARYFGDPRAVTVIRVLALSSALGGATNIGLVIARKELNFALGFKFETIVRIARFFVTIGLAVWLRSYWALVFARLITTALSIPLSYAMHSYRPRLSIACIGKYLRFGSAIVPMGIGSYLNGKTDVMIVGRFGGSSTLGVYNVASELAGMLTREILTPVGVGLLPSYAKLSHDRVRYSEAFRYVLSVSAALIFPVGLGLWVVGPFLVTLLLGDQWEGAIPLVQTLALYHMVGALLHTMSAQVLIASGHERRTLVVVWVRLALLIPAVVIAATFWGVEAIAHGAVVAAIIAIPFVVLVLTKSIALRYQDVIAAVWRPLAAALVMAAALKALPTGLVSGNLANLLLQVVSGAVAYFIVLWILWLISGQPSGLERVATDFATRKLYRDKSPG